MDGSKLGIKLRRVEILTENQILSVQTKFQQFPKIFVRQLFCDAFIHLLECLDSISKQCF